MTNVYVASFIFMVKYKILSWEGGDTSYSLNTFSSFSYNNDIIKINLTLITPHTINFSQLGIFPLFTSTSSEDINIIHYLQQSQITILTNKTSNYKAIVSLKEGLLVKIKDIFKEELWKG